MDASKTKTLLLCLICLSASANAQTPAPTPKEKPSAQAGVVAKLPDAKKAEALLKSLNATMTDWQRLRDEEIVVLELAPAKSGDDEKTQLEKRLEALQNKKISNREWYSYWQKEGQLCARVLSIYDSLVPADALTSAAV